MCIYPIYADDTMHLMWYHTISQSVSQLSQRAMGISVLINIIISSIEHFWHIWNQIDLGARHTHTLEMVWRSLLASLTYVLWLRLAGHCFAQLSQ